MFSIAFLIILGLFVWFILLPALRVGMAINRARKQARDFFGAMNGGASSGTRSSAKSSSKSSKSGSQPAPRRRKIDPSVAETVEFEEIACTVTETAGAGDRQSSTTASYTRTEAQIVDAEWEDIPS